MIGNIVTNRSKVLALVFSGTPVKNTRYYLPTAADIRSGFVTGLRIPYGNEIAASYSPYTVISGSMISYFTFTLIDPDGNPVLKNGVPYDYAPIYQNGKVRELDNLRIDPRKSFVTINDTTGFTSNVCILFDFYFNPSK